MPSNTSEVKLERVEVLCTIRSGKRQSATKTLNKVNVSISTINLEECKCYIDKLSTLKSNLSELDDKINSEKISNGEWTQEAYNGQLELDEEYSDRIGVAIVQLNERISSLSSFHAAIGGSASSHRVNNVQHKVTLPSIELPSFDGKPESFNKFINSFENLISKYNLSSFEKFSYLSKQLSGPAKRIIDSLSLNDLNYDSAKKLLTEAYSNKLDQQFSVINNLISLTLSPSACDAFSWIGDARLIDEQIRSLDITADIFAQYFLWNGLNEDFQRHLIAITQKSRPSLTEIRASMFEANSRYVEQRKTSPYQLSTSVAATSIKPPSNVQCSLCTYDKSSDRYHKLNQCPKYTDANAKITRLKYVNGCTKCGFTNHTPKTCTFKFFKNCFKCNGSHMTFLCHQSSNDREVKSEPKKSISTVKSDKSKVTTSTMSVVASATKVFNDVILPTATVYMVDDGGNIPVRLFKDLGSQSSFVKGSPDKIPGAVLVKTEQLSIKGINSVKNYSAPIVKFPINVPGQGEQFITAICVPNLITEVVAPGLAKLNSCLQRRGCVLADKFLNVDKMDDISILLGSDNSHVLPLNQCNFSSDNNCISVMFNTPAGIMLSGSVADYRKNINAIPPNLCAKD